MGSWRWISQDPVAGFLTRPYSLNRYTFCYNNPLINLDSDGKLPQLIIAYVTAVMTSPDLNNDLQQLAMSQNTGEAIINAVAVLLPGVNSVMVKGGVKATFKAVEYADEIIDVVKEIVPSSTRLGKNLVTAGAERGVDQAAHHIVAANSKKGEFARSILKKFGIGIDDAVNGVFLDKGVHSKLHTDEYYKNINEQLRGAKSKEDVFNILNDISQELSTSSTKTK